MKTCIFIVGDTNHGKTSTIRSLTGKGMRKGEIWKVRNKAGQLINAFVIATAISEDRPPKYNHFPENFPDSLETRFSIARTDYKMMICPLWQTTKKYAPGKYIEAALKQGFNVRVAAIEYTYDDQHSSYPEEEAFCKQKGVPFLKLDLRNDYVVEAIKIRNNFYP